MTLLEKVNVMLAFNKGAKVEICHILDKNKQWEDSIFPQWNWEEHNYRIKILELVFESNKKDLDLVLERLY